MQARFLALTTVLSMTLLLGCGNRGGQVGRVAIGADHRCIPPKIAAFEGSSTPLSNAQREAFFAFVKATQRFNIKLSSATHAVVQPSVAMQIDFLELLNGLVAQGTCQTVKTNSGDFLIALTGDDCPVSLRHTADPRGEIGPETHGGSDTTEFLIRDPQHLEGTLQSKVYTSDRILQNFGKNGDGAMHLTNCSATEGNFTLTNGAKIQYYETSEFSGAIDFPEDPNAWSAGHARRGIAFEDFAVEVEQNTTLGSDRATLNGTPVSDAELETSGLTVNALLSN